MLASARQAATWNRVPSRSSGTSNDVRVPAKYSSSCAAVCFRIGCSGSRRERLVMPARRGDSLGQRIARSPWSEAINVRTPTGVGCVVLDSGDLVCMESSLMIRQCGPELMGRVGPPGAPGGCVFRHLAQARAETKTGAGFLDAEIARQEGVGIAERAHHDVARGPFTDSRECEQLPVDLHTIRAGIERKPAAGCRRRQAAECCAPG